MPMSKTSTLIYLFENLDSEENKIIDYSFFEFSDVLKELNIKSISPPDAVIEKVLQYAKDYIH